MMNMDGGGRGRKVVYKKQLVVRKSNELKAHQMPALVLREDVEANDIDRASLSDAILRL